MIMLYLIDCREVQSEFRLRVLSEIRATHRVVDKLRERNTQRYMRFTRLAQEKRAKEKVYAIKVTKDALVAAKTTAEKASTKFQKDTKAWATGVAERCEAGKAAFNASSNTSSGAEVRI